LPADLSTIDAIQKVPQLVALFSSSDYEDIEPGDWLIATLTLGSDGGGSARGSVTSSLLCTKVERGLLTHLRDLLLELGRGFAFMGSQVPLEVAGESFYLDLLFYHVRLKCFFVIELKSGPFKPEWAGKLNFYLSAVDDRMRTSGDAPTIGLLLCEGHRSAIVEYTLFANRRRQLASHAIAGDADRLVDTAQGCIPPPCAVFRHFSLR
jgi:hypothetical protein